MKYIGLTGFKLTYYGSCAIKCYLSSEHHYEVSDCDTVREVIILPKTYCIYSKTRSMVVASYETLDEAIRAQRKHTAIDSEIQIETVKIRSIAK